ncbi:MAG: hypothetical protein P4L79_10660 [Legionella sp.]|uniref:hypothetical protein n=1 Tax=Legionella sp. TaxID=459 RepID=UPI00284986AB|nr:hypothetical protein [Legionella sp.]
MKELLLRVKIKSLTEETKIIRDEERTAKWKAKAAAARAKQESQEKHTSHFYRLHNHRTNDIRQEMRATHLAYGFLRGKSYREMERFSYTQPNWEKIEKMVEKYCDQDIRTVAQRYAQWKSEALEGIEAIPTGGVRLTFTTVVRPQPGSLRGMYSYWLVRGHETDFYDWKKSFEPVRVKKSLDNLMFVDANPYA